MPSPVAVLCPGEPSALQLLWDMAHLASWNIISVRSCSLIGHRAQDMCLIALSKLLVGQMLALLGVYARQSALHVDSNRAEAEQQYTPPVEESVTQLRTSVAGFSGLELGKPERVYVSLHASSQPGAQLPPSIHLYLLLVLKRDIQPQLAVGCPRPDSLAAPSCRGLWRVDVSCGLRCERCGGHGAC